MTEEMLLTGPWSAARAELPVRREAMTAAVVSEDTILLEQIAALLEPKDDLRLQGWRHGNEPLDAMQIANSTATAGRTLVCIGTDVPVDLALGVAAIADRAHPDMSVVIIAEPTPDLWREALRAGVRDVIDPGRVDLELESAMRRAIDRAARVRAQMPAATAADAPRAGGMIVVVSPKGGSGKTMVASNLATRLSQAADGAVALVDLDVQFGDAATALGLTPERSIGQLATVPALDSTTLKVFLTHHESSGAFVLSGTESPEEADGVTSERAARILELLTDDFAYVVVDTPAGLDERTLIALEQATDIVFVATMDVSSIRALGKEIKVLERLDLLSGRRHHFVLNRADARVGIETADVEAALGMTADAAVPSSRSVPLSMNQGRPIVLDSPTSPIGRELVKLSQRIAGSDDSGRRSRRLWRRK